MADTQTQPSAGAAGTTGEEREKLQPQQVRCMCARCVQRMVVDPFSLCNLAPPSRVANADTLCNYCHIQRGRCWKFPLALQPQILELQKRADEFHDWHWANSILPPARRSPWVLPADPPGGLYCLAGSYATGV
ncbi:hypothetical protein SBOR_2562 [Sclerotinia borealis F-4128]|uniref:Uncharacterized protein n=1 Tax=Sclerotinia borealis (strain F-4128) TaxID=1432307 RepID=W9CMK0_SCLBF|nr:hypothetical protein SBOR_2562 [Sclerotinia borealis F-4128]